MGDHTEAISIDYDPKVLSYEKLLDYFWKGHRCEATNRSVQYMNAVFYRNDDQKLIAEKSMKARAAQLGISQEKVETRILPIKIFTYAEGYHQKYYLTRYRELRDLLTKTYPDAKSLADSTVATRLNAYLGDGIERDWPAFAKELPKYDLPDDLETSLISAVKKLDQ